MEGSEITKRDRKLVEGLLDVYRELSGRPYGIIKDANGGTVMELHDICWGSSKVMSEVLSIMVLFSDAELQAKVRNLMSEYRGSED